MPLKIFHVTSSQQLKIKTMTNPYHNLRNTHDGATAIGRSKITDSIIDRLINEHVSIVGSHYIGKSCLLRCVADQISSRSEFDDVVMWDLRHPIVNDDDEFYRELSEALKNQIKNSDSDANQYFQEASNQCYKGISEFFDFIASNSKRVLIIMDGLDHPLSSGNIGVKVWNNMCALSDKLSATFLTASRERIFKLCDTKEIAGSHFWERLKDPVELGALNESEINEFLGDLESIGEIDPGARKEIRNWTGGIPILLLRLCDLLYDAAASGTTRITNQTVNEAAERCLNEGRDDLEAIWENCGTVVKTTFLEIIESQEILSSDVNEEVKKCLLLSGLALPAGNKLKTGARLIAKFSESEKQGVATIQNLFGKKETYESNIQALAGIRLASAQCPEKDFYDIIEAAIEKIHQPGICMNNIRNIVDYAFDYIWAIEASDGEIPRFTKGESTFGKLPIDLGKQVGILRKLAMGSYGVTPKKVNRKIYALISFLQDAGNLGQHRRQEGRQSRDFETFGVNWAACCCMVAIQMLEELIEAEILTA